MKTVVCKIKHIAMCCLMMLVVSSAIAQNYQAKHEVQRGETLASVAEKYGVTEQMIKEANPQMGNLFYVGLKLNIPAKAVKSKVTRSSDKAQSAKTQSAKVQSEKAKDTNKQSAKEQSNKAQGSKVITTESHSNRQAKASKKKSTSYSQAYKNALGGVVVENGNNASVSTSTGNDYIHGDDYTLRLDFGNPYSVGFSFATDAGRYSFLYMGWAFSGYDPDKKKSYDNTSFGSCIMGYGAKHRVAFEPFLLQVKMFPYIGLAMSSYYEGKDQKESYDFTYGVSANASLGLKIFRTGKGNDLYITAGYYIDAPKFETKDMIENGAWGFGVTFVWN